MKRSTTPIWRHGRGGAIGMMCDILHKMYIVNYARHPLRVTSASGGLGPTAAIEFHRLAMFQESHAP